MSIIQALIAVIVFVGVSSIHEYNFSKYCGKSIPIPTDGQMILKYRGERQTSPCVVDVLNNKINTSEVVLAHFIDVDIAQTLGCNITKLEIFDDSKVNPSKRLTGPNGICSNNLTTGNYNSTQKHMAFSLQNDDTSATFRLLLTAVQKGTCRNHEFDCGNGFCIPDNLVCSGFNNCGNMRNEVDCILGLAVWAIVLIILGSLVVLTCVSIMLFCLVCRPRRRRTMYRQI